MNTIASYTAKKERESRANPILAQRNNVLKFVHFKNDTYLK